jgi:hypothetical protein
MDFIKFKDRMKIELFPIRDGKGKTTDEYYYYSDAFDEQLKVKTSDMHWTFDGPIPLAKGVVDDRTSPTINVFITRSIGGRI